MHRAPYPVTYCVRAPHPPSERQTDAGRLPPWLPGVVMSAAPERPRAGRRVEAVNSPHPQNPAGRDDSAVICSAKGCRTAAVWVLAWNNPKLHTPDRRKTWLACEEHREHLSQFLGVRGFLKDVVTLAEWEAAAPGR
ncbi:hypothetical protein GCM10012285_56230 [Streptomyces kronopolitis]|uniref:Acetone carboxylase n=1 Tax=Streptomyces kronopolitis TaxID=1612435 RepID=A0ABQ2JZN3_9ACTN|nr:hypothetical protein GCM10012285_56230 [Streptomyces kronopolitis]